MPASGLLLRAECDRDRTSSLNGGAANFAMWSLYWRVAEALFASGSRLTTEHVHEILD
jgi:hypothetical protein